MSEPDHVTLALPFRGTWLARNSPARRVPSHGTHLFATTYAMDFIAVQGRRTAGVRDWRTLVATEPPDRFYAFGLPILAPAAGTVVTVHDGEPDHEARRSQLTRVSYALTQAARARQGAGAIAGNHVILQLRDQRAYAVLAHLRAGSLRVAPGDEVDAGQQLGDCGNSGNSLQPHLHIQVMDSADPFTARGLPMAFAGYRAQRRADATPTLVARGVPHEAEIVEPLTGEVPV
jgi:murein DD-endopeptidase MepM/ murein hydrolase activator NlpD